MRIISYLSCCALVASVVALVAFFSYRTSAERTIDRLTIERDKARQSAIASYWRGASIGYTCGVRAADNGGITTLGRMIDDNIDTPMIYPQESDIRSLWVSIEDNQP